MGSLRKRIEERLRVYAVPKADGGNHEDAYAALKAFCDGLPDDYKGSPVEILATHILDDVKRHLGERRRARGEAR